MPLNLCHDVLLQTNSEVRDWASLPADLLYRVSRLLDDRTELPCLLRVCSSWHHSLKATLTELRIHNVGAPALGSNFTSVRRIDASILRSTLLGFRHLAPVRNLAALGTQFPSLVSLNVAGQQLGQHGLQVLLPLAGRLQHLDASRCDMSIADMSALASLTHLTSLAFNAVKAVKEQSVTGSASNRPEIALAAELATILPRLSQLRRLELCLKRYPTRPSAINVFAAAQQPHSLQDRRAPCGLPMYGMAGCLASLPDLNCLLLRNQPLHPSDTSALASLSALTELALLWQPPSPSPTAATTALPPPAPLTAALWAQLVNGPLRHSLLALDVDFGDATSAAAGGGGGGFGAGGGEQRVWERLSVAPLVRLRALRLRRCVSPLLLLSIMGAGAPATAGG
ncbi:hypothetical protein Agub_g7464, partial [Astrephomene gubernaculifera]